MEEEHVIKDVTSDFNTGKPSIQCCCSCHLARRLTNQRKTCFYTQAGSYVGSWPTGTRQYIVRTSYNGRLRERIENRTRNRTFNKTLRTGTNSLCQRWKHIFTKRKMVRIVIYFVILLMFVSVGAYVIKRSSKHMGGDSKLTDLQYVIDNPEGSGVILDLPFKKVPLTEFQHHLSSVEDPFDVLRIFFDHGALTDSDITSIMKMKSMNIYKPKHRREDDEYEYHDVYQEGVFDERDFESAMDNVLDMNRNPLALCRDPRPEIEKVYSKTGNKYYAPSCTVVHRCRNTSGCCPANHVCSPKRIQVIDKFFMVLDLDPENHVSPNGREFVELRSFINHTECECRPIETVSDCPKRCPRHFEKIRPGAECQCDCHKDHGLCHDIKRGKTQLEEDDLVCIKERKCLIPNCNVGKFKVRTGFCPDEDDIDFVEQKYRRRGKR